MYQKIQNYKLIFVHGWTSSSGSDWYPALMSILDEVGVDYSIPNLPGYKAPHSKEWLQIIHAEINKTAKPVILIGHSLGTRAVLLYLDQYETNVEQVFLIAPLSNEIKNAERRGGEAYPDFFEYRINLSKVKKLSKKWLILHSRDDQSLDYEEHGASLSKEMKVELKSFDDEGHFTKLGDAECIFKTLKEEIG